MTRETNSNGTLNAYVVRGIEVEPNDHYGYKIVAVISGEGHFWSAYMGLTDWSDSRVAAEGDKILPAVAEKLFPTLANNFEYYY